MPKRLKFNLIEQRLSSGRRVGVSSEAVNMKCGASFVLQFVTAQEEIDKKQKRAKPRARTQKQKDGNVATRLIISPEAAHALHALLSNVLRK